MGARPAVAAIAADHHIGEPRLDGHDAENDRKNLARAPIVEGGREGHVNAQPLRHDLVMRIDIVRTTHDQTIHIPSGETSLHQCGDDGLLEKGQ
jgi:hypothetical protein